MLDDQTSARRLSSVISRLRSNVGATQAAVAKEANLDQSRVSRIEKGEVSNPADLERVLDALLKLGSAEVADYRTFSSLEWVHIDPPLFWNPQRGVLEVAEQTLGKIEEFLVDLNHPWPLRRAIESHKSALLRGAAFVNRMSHNIAFIGDMGVGKSTALAVVFDLLVPGSPSAMQTERCVLETGAGGTTICEVHVRRGPEYGMSIQPMTDSDLRDLVSDFCVAKWVAVKDKMLRDVAAISRESERAIRNMTGLTRKTSKVGGKTTTFDPLLDLVTSCSTVEELRVQILERMKLGERTRRDIWYEPNTYLEPLEWLSKVFRGVNNGRLSDVSLPKSIDLIIPDFGKEFGELDITIIDTKGVQDGAVREDLDRRLRDPRTAVVFCCKFNDAPGVTSRTLLKHMRDTFSEPLTAGKVCILALPQPGESLAMKDDMGETALTDEEGYALKSMQVEADIRDTQLPDIPIFFFNAQSDEPETTRRELLRQVTSIRDVAGERLFELCRAVEDILGNQEHQKLVYAVQEVANKLRHFLDAHFKLKPRQWLPYSEVIKTVKEVRYASTLWAATRRSGYYSNLNIMHLVGVGAARDSAFRCQQFFSSLDDMLKSLVQDQGLAIATRTINQIGQSAASSRVEFLDAVQRAGMEIYHEPLTNSPVWNDCVSEWGMGPGFKARVAEKLEKWFHEESSLNEALESLVNNLWAKFVIAPLRHLSEEPEKSTSPSFSAENANQTLLQ
jgi:transcriptional regulator with XRE-family HTH domain